ncbi:MAG: ATP-binding cassette domain-containing protein [Lentilitoribacter sp.]
MTLSVSGLTSTRSGRTILYPTSLTFEPGARIGLVGSSGSGKSTLGHVLIDTLRAQGELVAHVPQSPDEALDPLRRLDFHWREAEVAMNTEHDRQKQEKLFDALHIKGADLTKRPWSWSRGMQQRFVIAMALIGTPSLIILDEPTSALDPVVAADTMKLLQEYLSHKNTAMLFITHDLGLASKHVDRLMVMHEGKIVEDATTQDILQTPKTEAAKLLSSHKSWLSLPC